MALTIRDEAKTRDPRRTLWVFRYYDLNDRSFRVYGDALVRLIDFIRELAAVGTGDARTTPKVNIIAHSMGGLIVREAIQGSYPQTKRRADDYINKVVTLGTPHQGISFQVLSHWIGIDASDELDHFSPDFQAERKAPNPLSFRASSRALRPAAVPDCVGTNYRTYGVRASSWANRLFSVADEFGPNYNRSDGLVKQQSAQIPGRRGPSSTSVTAASIRWSRRAKRSRSPRGSSSATCASGSHDRRQGDARKGFFR